MTNSIQKGKAGEREFRDRLRAHGFSAERGAQHKGTPDSPDVICPSLPFHFEVKIGGRILLRAAYLQACQECGDQIPIVAHRSTRRGTSQTDLRTTEPWMVSMSADDFLKIIKKQKWTSSLSNINIQTGVSAVSGLIDQPQSLVKRNGSGKLGIA